MYALVFIGMLSIPAFAASSSKKGAPTILLFLGPESDENRDDDGSLLSDGEEEAASSENAPAEVEEPPPAWDEFSDSHDSLRTDEDLDPGSWSQVLEQPSVWDTRNPQVRVYYRCSEPLVQSNNSII